MGRRREFERHEIEWKDESVESYAQFMLDSFGPLLNARELLAEREGELDEAYRGFLERENEADDGTLRFRGEYLVSVVAAYARSRRARGPRSPRSRGPRRARRR